LDLVDYLDADLSVEESVQKFLYDDATGKRFLKGMTLVGNLTIAIGVNLMDGMDDEEIKWISVHRMQKVLDYFLLYPWFATLDQVRQTAIADIAFNIGLDVTAKWPTFFHYVVLKDWPNAKKEISSNAVWISQVHAGRASRIENMIESGQWPTDIKYG
jgi:GH24 family phage-related lysozyme (muramidase)